MVHGARYKVQAVVILKTFFRSLDFAQTREWEMTHLTFHHEDDVFLMHHLYHDETFSTIRVELTLKRTPAFLTTTMVAPIILIMLLTNIGLILPVESGEKMGYTITIFLTLVVYMEYIAQQIPPWQTFSDTPRIVRFFMMALARELFRIFEKFYPKIPTIKILKSGEI